MTPNLKVMLLILTAGAGLFLSTAWGDIFSPLQSAGLPSRNSPSVKINQLNLKEYKSNRLVNQVYCDEASWVKEKDTIVLKKFQANGNHPVRGKETLSAQEGQYSQTRKIAEAQGGVVFNTGSNILKCNSLVWNLNDKTISVRGSFQFSNQMQSLSAYDLEAKEDMSEINMKNIEASGK